MSADIEKLAVFDDRIVQSRPRYAVEKGALSVTNSPFNAIAANTSQHTYNILVPSENIFIDRAVDWTSTCFLQGTLAASAIQPVAPPGGEGTLPLVPVGLNAALCPFPLQALTTTMTATINDTTTTINTQDVLPQVLRMTDMRKNRLVRTCPTMLDRYQSNSDSVGTANSPLNGYDAAISSDQVPNGAFSGLVFTTSTGVPLTQAVTTAPGGVYQDPTYGWVATATAPYPCVPTLAQDAGGIWAAGSGTAATNVTFYCAFTSCEKMVLSPFVFSDVHEWDTGLFGCQNIQLVMNLGAQQVNRVLRYAPVTYDATYTLGNVTFNNSGSSSGAFSGSRVNIQFLTPSLDVPLPPKSVVPYMEYPRYISSQLPQFSPGDVTQYSSQTITLPQIPDLLIIYAKPSQGYTYPNNAANFGGQGDPNQADWMFPITNISVNFDNFAGLLSAQTQQQLYKLSVHNGLDQDWLAWSGSAWVSSKSKQLPLVGGMLVLKPGRDIVLQAGQAPSLVGNFVLQFQLTLRNNTSSVQNPSIYVITANSGFFETIKGSSRVIKGVLTEQDIISAPVAPGGTSGALRRAVGAGVHGSMGNALHHLKSMFGHSGSGSGGSGGSKPSASELASAHATPKAKGRGAPQQVANALASRLM
jgi:hypothetical protein